MNAPPRINAIGATLLAAIAVLSGFASIATQPKPNATREGRDILPYRTYTP